MDTNTPLNAPIRNHGLGSGRKPASQLASRPSLSGLAKSAIPRASAETDWQATGIVDQMSAYSDWWNLPVRRPQPAAKAR